MTKKNPFNEFQKYLKNYPELVEIMSQLEIDEETYFKSLGNLDSNIIIPKVTSSDNTYNF